MFITSMKMTAFFAEPVQMDLPAATHVAITQEGLEYLAYIVKFDKKNIKQITDNLRCPDGRVPDPDPNAAEGATIPTRDLFLVQRISFVLRLHLRFLDTTRQPSVPPVLPTCVGTQSSKLSLKTGSSPRRPFFLHTISFE